MPLNKKGKKIMKSMKEQYGSKKGKSIFYATMNKGKIKGVEKKAEGGIMKKKPYEKFKDTTKKEYENKKKRFPMIPQDEFDIRFENNPDFFESGVSRAYTGGLMSKKNKRLKELEEELGIRTKPTKPAPETGSPDSTPPKKGPVSQGMKQGGDIDARVEEELKKETPNAYPIMKGASPVTHLRKFLMKRKLERQNELLKEINESDKDKGIGLYMEPQPKKVSKKSGGMIKARGNKLARSKPTKIC